MSHFENQNFPLKTSISSSFVSGFQKCHLFCRTTEIPTIDFHKMTSLPLPGRWAIAQPKIKILAWHFVQLLLARSSIVYIPFFISSTFWILLVFVLWKIEILIFKGQKPEISKIRDGRLVERVMSHLLVFLIAFYLKILRSRSLSKLAVFRPKIAWHNVTKTPFFENFSIGFKLLFQNAKLMLNKVS